MSSQAQGTLEGELNGPSYEPVQAGERPGQPLLNGPVQGVSATVGYGSAASEYSAAGNVTVTGQAVYDGVHNIQGAHNAPPTTSTTAQHQQQPQQTPEPMMSSGTAITPQRDQERQDDPYSSTQPEPPLLPAQQPMSMPLRPPAPSSTQVMESMQSVTMRMTTSPPEELPGPAEGRGNQSVWMVRLGEFFQRRINQATAAVAPVLERPPRGPARSLTTPPSSWASVSPRVPQLPLFGQEAERTMQQWPQQAPLLYGQGVGGQGRDADSSTGSLTQEQVLAEVRRQVQMAMQPHQAEMASLRRENEQLRAFVARQDGTYMLQPTVPPSLREGNPARPLGGEDQQRVDVRGEVHVGLSRGPCGTWGNDGGGCEGEGVRVPPQGLEEVRAGDQGGYHGPAIRRGGDPVNLSGGHVVPPGHQHGSASGLHVEDSVRQVTDATGTGLVTDGGDGNAGVKPAPVRPVDEGNQGRAAVLSAHAVSGTPPTATSTSGPTTSAPPPQPRSTVDPFDMLARGMAQLQNAMAASMTSKGTEPEQVKPGISELPRLPELSETSCIDVGDWLHALENPMGDLSNSSAAWWHEVLLCLDRFYAAYLKSSNLSKLSLKPEAFASAAVKEDKWSRVEKRATSMLLASLPESVRTEILASRLTGALQVLGRVMVLYRPGSTAERQQILKALELPPVATTASEAVDALRRWSRWLRRASDVGVQSPDPSILLRGLDGMVKRVLQENNEILFRINMMRYTLEVDVKPTQKAVEDLHQALLSEFEQVAFRGRNKPATTPSLKAATATSATTPSSVSGVQDGGADGSPPKVKGAPCKFFLTDQGCRRGVGCKYSHEVDRKQKQGRCWTCGSKQHVSKVCPTKDKTAGGRSPTRPSSTRPEASAGSPSLATIAPENAHPSPSTPASPAAASSSAPAASTTSTTASQPGEPPAGEGDLRSLLKEANSMLKEMRQLRMLTVQDVAVSAKALGMDPESGRTRRTREPHIHTDLGLRRRSMRLPRCGFNSQTEKK